MFNDSINDDEASPVKPELSSNGQNYSAPKSNSNVLTASTGVAVNANPSPYQAGPSAAQLQLPHQPLASDVTALKTILEKFDSTQIVLFSLPVSRQPRFQQSKKKNMNDDETSAISIVNCYYYLTVSCLGAFTIRCSLQPALDALSRHKSAQYQSSYVATSQNTAEKSRYLDESMDSEEDIDIIKGTRPTKKTGRGTHSDRSLLSNCQRSGNTVSQDRGSQRSQDLARVAERERLMAIVARNAPQLYARLEALRGDVTSRDAMLTQMQEKYGKFFYTM